MRQVLLDYDSRPEPKTKRFCVKCQRDIKPNQPARVVRLLEAMVLHRDDAADVGQDWLVGMDCATDARSRRGRFLEWASQLATAGCVLRSSGPPPDRWHRSRPANCWNEPPAMRNGHTATGPSTSTERGRERRRR